ncbi:MAG: hypothetical protein QOF55_2433, partial [Thermoleophilaceae bacterium]|nr:hypothetical protein [Thermoleophilaceae bacterium]
SHKLDDFAIKGKKEQSLYDFPEEVDISELYDVVCATCGLDRANVTLSERHIQIYEANAAPEPPAHKDRFPSQVSMGFSISIPAESRLVLYPYSHRETNPFNTSAGLRRHLQPHELPEVALKDARELVLDDADRDVVMFPGSTTWHLRRQAANALNLYLKFNDFGLDPLGEDPFTEGRRARTLAAVEAGAEALGALVPVLSRRLDTVSRTATRDGWREVLEARVFGEEPVGLTGLQHEALLTLDGSETLGAIAARLGDPQEAARQLARLAELGVLDLVDAPVVSATRQGERREKITR